MRSKQAAAIAISVAIVIGAYLAWQTATGSFNPNPRTVSFVTTSCSPSSPPCPAFSIESILLTVKNRQDITSQWLNISVTATGPSQIDRIGVYFSNFAIGNLTAVVLPGRTATAGWAVPTTVSVSRGETYGILVESTYVDPGTKQSVQYWSSANVVAS